MKVRGFEELSTTGVLWAINRTVFHPLGYALGIHTDPDGTVTGWSILGDGTQPWKYLPDVEEDTLFETFHALLGGDREGSGVAG